MEVESRPSVASEVRIKVSTAPVDTFFRCSDFAGSRRAVESALSRLAAEGTLVRVRRGLYWRGKATRFGMTGPSKLDVALVVAGPGSGPAGVSAARMLGLTSQVPGVVEVAVSGRAPEPVAGVRFRSRSFSRRERGLTPLEVALLEVLRDPGESDAGWRMIGERVSDLVAHARVRVDVITDEVAEEHHILARERWGALAAG